MEFKKRKLPEFNKLINKTAVKIGLAKLISFLKTVHKEVKYPITEKTIKGKDDRLQKEKANDDAANVTKTKSDKKPTNLPKKENVKNFLRVVIVYKVFFLK